MISRDVDLCEFCAWYAYLTNITEHLQLIEGMCVLLTGAERFSFVCLEECTDISLFPKFDTLNIFIPNFCQYECLKNYLKMSHSL